MGLFFLLAGYFTPSSYARKGPKHFMMDRAIRLLIPLAFYELLLSPIIFYIAHTAPDPNNPQGFAAATNVYQWYFQRYTGVGRNPMWFVAVLFIFSSGYTLFAWLKRLPGCSSCCRNGQQVQLQQQLLQGASAAPLEPGEHPEASVPATAACAATTNGTEMTSAAPPGSSPPSTAAWPLPHQQQEQQAPFTARFMLLSQSLLILAMGTIVFLIRWGIGDMWNSYGITFQVNYTFGQYLLSFILGMKMQETNAFARIPAQYAFWGAGVGLLWFIAAFIVEWALRLRGYETKGAYTAPWALFYSFQEMGFAVLWSTGLLAFACKFCTCRPSQFWGKRLIGSAYTTYIIHPLFLVLFTLALNPASLAPLVFFVVMCPLVLLSTWITAAAICAIPGASYVL